ncbi:MAG: alpha/beta hydrolase [Methylococcaceae bacterium]|nr:alpha/beta hydrolase [Methylococcaceae bacterium]
MPGFPRYIFLLLLAVPYLLTGCDLLAFQEQQQKMKAFCLVRGSVRPEAPGDGELIVLLFRHKGGLLEQISNWSLVDHFVLEQAGRWELAAKPGTFYLTAFQDLNHDQVIERDEPAIPLDDASKLFHCDSGEIKGDIELVIPQGGRIPVDTPADIPKSKTRPAAEPLNVSLGQVVAVGEVTSLDDPRFSKENAEEGLWRPFDFTWETKSGIFFLAPYDRWKIPVLFVHGMDGTPRDFRFLIEHLDRSRFQPWVTFYASAGHLDNLASYSNQLMLQLKAKYGYRTLFVVAHSMGGLISRQAILNYTDKIHDDLIPLFVSIASPWNGHHAAQVGVDYAPAAIYSWIDLAPGSQFLTRLYYHPGKSERRRLPSNLSHHLIFTFLGSESGDGTVSLESQLRPEAQEEATRLYGISQSHTGVLDDPKTSELLNRLLLDARKSLGPID